MKTAQFVLASLLFVACAHNAANQTDASPSSEKACGYPKGCYCQPVDEHTGLLVNNDGQVSLGPVMCLPDAEDLSRTGSFCLPVVGESRGVKVVGGRIQLETPGHTHDVQASGPVWCEAKQ